MILMIWLSLVFGEKQTKRSKPWHTEISRYNSSRSAFFSTLSQLGKVNKCPCIDKSDSCENCRRKRSPGNVQIWISVHFGPYILNTPTTGSFRVKHGRRQLKDSSTRGFIEFHFPLLTFPNAAMWTEHWTSRWIMACWGTCSSTELVNTTIYVLSIYLYRLFNYRCLAISV